MSVKCMRVHCSWACVVYTHVYCVFVWYVPDEYIYICVNWVCGVYVCVCWVYVCFCVCSVDMCLC